MMLPGFFSLIFTFQQRNMVLLMISCLSLASNKNTFTMNTKGIICIDSICNSHLQKASVAPSTSWNILFHSQTWDLPRYKLVDMKCRLVSPHCWSPDFRETFGNFSVSGPRWMILPKWCFFRYLLATLKKEHDVAFATNRMNLYSTISLLDLA